MTSTNNRLLVQLAAISHYHKVAELASAEIFSIESNQPENSLDAGDHRRIALLKHRIYDSMKWAESLLDVAHQWGVQGDAFDNHIRKYQVVLALKSEELESAVAAFIENGWQPFGGMSIRKDEDKQINWCQPMIKIGGHKSVDAYTLIMPERN